MSDAATAETDRATTTEEITRTVRCKLETSRRKNEQLQAMIDDYQAMVSYAATMMPSIGPEGWQRSNPAIYRLISDEFKDADREVTMAVAREAANNVAASFKSWRSRGMPGERPYEFEDLEGKNYISIGGQNLSVVENDRGWGVEIQPLYGGSLWFHVDDSPFQREFLQRVTDEDDDATAGSAELHLADGTAFCHLTVSWEVEVFEPTDVDRVVGVDLNDDPLFAAAVVDDDGVVAVDMQGGAEYRHTRERLKRKRAEAMEGGSLREIKRSGLTYDRYTDHITNVASRRVVDLAVEHAPCLIRLEDLTHYRETAKDPLHDWPFAEIAEKIASKATEEGIPVDTVDPRQTSVTCRKCGTTDDRSREGVDFDCVDCGYEVHADVNAAINVARGGVVN